MILILSIIIILIIILIKTSNTNIEGFDKTKICYQYLNESVNKYPCANKTTKRQFLDWCNSFRRRHGFFLNIDDAMSKFYRFHITNSTFESL